MAAVLLWQRTPTAWETMRPHGQGGTPHHPHLPGTQKIPGMGDKGRLVFFFFVV